MIHIEMSSYFIIDQISFSILKLSYHVEWLINFVLYC